MFHAQIIGRRLRSVILVGAHVDQEIVPWQVIERHGTFAGEEGEIVQSVCPAISIAVSKVPFLQYIAPPISYVHIFCFYQVYLSVKGLPSEAPDSRGTSDDACRTHTPAVIALQLLQDGGYP